MIKFGRIYLLLLLFCITTVCIDIDIDIDKNILYEEPIERLNELSEISENDDAITRTFFSKAHKKCAIIIAKWMKEAGLNVYIDILGNVHGTTETFGNAEKVLVIGSHYDSVVNGGKYDGTLGIISAIAAVKYLNMKLKNKNYLNSKNNKQTKSIPLHLIAFSEEEGVRFQTAYIGSRAVSGKLKIRDLREIRDKDNISLYETLMENGLDGNFTLIEDIKMNDKEIEAYIEIHTEQGSRLMKSNKPIGIVKNISGQTRITVEIKGEQNHAGTVLMYERKDALFASAEIIYNIEQLCKYVSENCRDDQNDYTRLIKELIEKNKNELLNHQSFITCTIGKLIIIPGSTNVIPGMTKFSIDIRSDNNSLRILLVKLISSIIFNVTEKRQLEYKIIKNMDKSTVHCSNDLIDRLKESSIKAVDTYNKYLLNDEDVENYNNDVMLLSSGAGHDAVIMAEITNIGMIFIRDNGFSHSPVEHVEPPDITIGILSLIHFLNNKYHLNIIEHII